MKIAVIGKGNIGGTLGSKWRAAGHDVVFGARDGSGEGPGGAPVRGIGDALDGAEVLRPPGQAGTRLEWTAPSRAALPPARTAASRCLTS